MGKVEGRSARTANVACYDDYYEKPQLWFRLRYRTQIKRKTVVHLIRRAGKSFRNQRVLDIGFGCGSNLWSFDSESEIHGIDISHSAIKNAEAIAKKKGYAGFSFQKPTGPQLDYPDDRFDIVIASHVLEHVDDDVALLKEIRRVLAPGGVAIVLIPINEKYEDPNHVRRYNPALARGLFRRLGLEPIVQIENECLFVLMERFFFSGWDRKWGLPGRAIAAGFNITTSTWPFLLYRFTDRLLQTFGARTRQYGVALRTTL